MNARTKAIISKYSLLINLIAFPICVAVGYVAYKTLEVSYHKHWEEGVRITEEMTKVERAKHMDQSAKWAELDRLQQKISDNSNPFWRFMRRNPYTPEWTLLLIPLFLYALCLRRIRSIRRELVKATQMASQPSPIGRNGTPYRPSSSSPYTYTGGSGLLPSGPTPMIDHDANRRLSESAQKIMKDLDLDQRIAAYNRRESNYGYSDLFSEEKRRLQEEKDRRGY